MTDFYVKMHKSLKSQIDVCKLCFTSVKANFCCSMLYIFLAKRTTYLLHCNQNEKEVIFSNKLLLLTYFTRKLNMYLVL